MNLFSAVIKVWRKITLRKPGYYIIRYIGDSDDAKSSDSAAAEGAKYPRFLFCLFIFGLRLGWSRVRLSSGGPVDWKYRRNLRYLPRAVDLWEQIQRRWLHRTSKFKNAVWWSVVPPVNKKKHFLKVVWCMVWFKTIEHNFKQKFYDMI